jgi:uncharacterized BrkB/YihY/UPF0761 family membrane protein
MLGLQLVLGYAVAVIPAIVGLIIVAARGQGRARSLGLIGFVIAAAIGVVTQTVNLFIPRIVNTIGLASYGVFGSVWGIVVMLLYVGQMIILALAIVATRSTVPQPEPAAAYGYNQPPTSG